MELKGRPAKEITYINTLLEKFSQSWTRRLKKKVFNGNENYSKSDLAEILSHRNDDYAYQFLDKLEEEGVLEHAGKREHSSGGVPVYKFHRKRLLKSFADSEYYQQHRDLFVKTLEAAENKELI
jgi:hypothetical protein